MEKEPSFFFKVLQHQILNEILSWMETISSIDCVRLMKSCGLALVHADRNVWFHPKAVFEGFLKKLNGDAFLSL